MSEPTPDFREHELPRALRRGHAKVVDARSQRERRDAAFYLWQDTLVHLASLAFAEYRRHRLDSPAPRVENVLKKWPRPWAENYAELLRGCLAEGPQPGIFAAPLADNLRLKEAEKLRRAVDAVDTAVEAAYPTCATLVERELVRPGKQSIQLGPMLNLFVDYRNKAIGHQDTSKWREIEDLDQVLAPLVQETAFELLANAQVQRVILDHPVGEHVDERQVQGGVEHAGQSGVP